MPRLTDREILIAYATQPKPAFILYIKPCDAPSWEWAENDFDTEEQALNWVFPSFLADNMQVALWCEASQTLHEITPL